MISRSAKPGIDESDIVQAAANTQNLWHFSAVCCKNGVIIVTIGISVIIY